MKRLLLLLALSACSSKAPALVDASAPLDAEVDATAPVDAGADAGVDKAAACAASFGTELTNAFGRVDGTILAVVPPTNGTCALPNSTHLVLQLTMHGAAYRMVVNVDGKGPDPRVFLAEKDAPLAAGPWSEGWHPGAKLDYVTTLGVSSTAFVAPTDLVGDVTRKLEIGARVSVFATSSGGTNAGNAHLVHRNLPDADGAIVISPDTSPHYLLFRFADQTF
jgi:hypothetical protein